MKLFLYALMTSLFLFVGCESYNRQDDNNAIQEQQEQEENTASDEVDTKPFPDKGGNAGNK